LGHAPAVCPARGRIFIGSAQPIPRAPASSQASPRAPDRRLAGSPGTQIPGVPGSPTIPGNRRQSAPPAMPRTLGKPPAKQRFLSAQAPRIAPRRSRTVRGSLHLPLSDRPQSARIEAHRQRCRRIKALVPEPTPSSPRSCEAQKTKKPRDMQGFSARVSDGTRTRDRLDHKQRISDRYDALKCAICRCFAWSRNRRPNAICTWIRGDSWRFRHLSP
jgi:hypothetical protein